MENSITKAFNSKDFGWLEVIDIDGKTYFPATDCARMLGYTNPQKAIRDHCKTDGCTICSGVSETVNQYGKVTRQQVEKKYIDEGNLYRLITHSKLPTAEQFERWVFDEVLPEIRQSGGYGLNGIQNRNTELANIIGQAVTVAVTETVKQLIPLMKYESIGCEDDEIAVKRQRRRIAGTIEKLPRAMRNRMDEMLLGTMPYREIQAYLRLNGVNISASSIHRYAQHLYNDEF